MSLFSVIVPVFNSEKYLKKCLDSVVNQSYSDFEIILIDDGSRDNSGKICDEYSKIDNRIKVFHQDNKGVSDARNKGISEASGDYILFVDSDDWINKDTLKKLSLKLDDKIELLMFQIIDHTTKPLKVTNQYEYNKKISQMIIDESINSPVNKLYKLEVLKNNNIQFNNNISIAEDLLFNVCYFSKITTFEIIQDEFYYYSKDNDNSLTKRYNKEKYKELMFVDTEIEKILKKYKSIHINKAIKYIRIKNIFSCIRDMNNTECLYSIKEKKEQIRKIRKDNKIEIILGNGIKPFIYSCVYNLIRSPYFLLKFAKLKK